MEPLFSEKQLQNMSKENIIELIQAYQKISTQEILDTYTERWPIELFFRQNKNNSRWTNIRSAHGRESSGTG